MDYTTKSAYINKFGAYDVIQVGPAKLPPLDGLIEVAVKYCGMNFADIYMREGLFPVQFPFTLGIECCGVVTHIGQGTKTKLKVGDRVICYNMAGGLYRDKVRINPKNCYLLHSALTFEDGAAFFVNYMTAYVALYEIAKLDQGKSVFVRSCAGGLGCAVAQLTKICPNTKVYGTASPGKVEFAKANGVDEVILHENMYETIAEKIPEGFDIIIENEASTSCNKMVKFLKPLGIMILLGANDMIGNNERLTYFKIFKNAMLNLCGLDKQQLILNNITVAGLHLAHLCESLPDKVEKILYHIQKLLAEKQITPKIDSIWPLEEISIATKKMVMRQNVGKILIKID